MEGLNVNYVKMRKLNGSLCVNYLAAFKLASSNLHRTRKDENKQLVTVSETSGKILEA